MTDESIELLKNWEPKQMQWPAMVQEKLDGVPVRIRRIGSHVLAWSRQNEPIVSIPHILQYAGVMLQDGGSIVGELYIQGLPFKTIGGYVRQKKYDANSAKLVLNVFDFDQRNAPALAYEARRATFVQSLDNLSSRLGKALSDLPIRAISGVIVYDEKSALAAYDMIMQAKPAAEGVVVHSLEKAFQPGKRCWGTQRIKPVPTIDLKIIGFEEAMSLKTGAGLGMVGRLNAEYSYMKKGKLVTTIIGVGPGALTHPQRRALWNAAVANKYKPTVAEIKYMRDETYDALRQPTFVRFRPEKGKADVN